MDPASGCHLWRPPVVACRIRTRARKQRGHEWHSRGGFALDALRCVGDGPYRCQMAFGDVEVPLAPSSDQYTHPHYLPHHHPHHTTHTVCARRDDPSRVRAAHSRLLPEVQVVPALDRADAEVAELADHAALVLRRCSEVHEELLRTGGNTTAACAERLHSSHLECS